MGKSPKNLYLILGVDELATPATIKDHYRRLALKNHPDRNNGSQEATLRMQEINGAYGVLRDTQKRAFYDRYLTELRQSNRTSNENTSNPNPTNNSTAPDSSDGEARATDRMEDIIEMWLREVSDLAIHARIETKNSLQAGLRAGFEALVSATLMAIFLGFIFRACSS
jgi:DnaJ-class molecular chaperone